MTIYQLPDKLIFPSPEDAEPEGLLAVGGDLRPERLLLAYSSGIFPWYSEGLPILWWSPDPRLILEPANLHIPRRLWRVIKKRIFTITCDQSFETVIQECANTTFRKEKSTWLVKEMIDAYIQLHKIGFAHSVESWYEGKLVGGLYGVSLGKVFFGESMFYRMKDASKVALVYLVKLLHHWEFTLIDCQVTTNHLIRFGAREIPRSQFLKLLTHSLKYKTIRGRWHLPETLTQEIITSKKIPG